MDKNQVFPDLIFQGGKIREDGNIADEMAGMMGRMEMQIAADLANDDAFFLIIMAILVFFMQTGFAFLEAGSVRAKNTTNILLKNLLDVCLGAVAYYALGYAFAFGEPSNVFISHGNFFFVNFAEENLSYFFFHFVFAATASTIVSGAMAERTEFLAYLIYSFVITGFIYPVVSHWAWSSSGWLGAGIYSDQVGYMDFAGSSVVHMVGGMAALVGAIMVGPRIGRFNPDGSSNTIQGHTVPMVALGGFILFFGFFAFNGGSQASISQPGDGVIVSNAIVNTIMSGAFAALTTLFLTRMLFGTRKWSLLSTINGGLTGMVAICAGCNLLYAWGAVITGIVSGLVYLLASYLVEIFQVDDPLDAVAVHFAGGLWGVFSAPLLAKNVGVFFSFSGESFVQWGWNMVGACAIMAWTFVLSLILFGSMRLTGILRVSAELEKAGLDVYKHGEPAYPVESYINSGGPMMSAALMNGHSNGTSNHKTENGLKAGNDVKPGNEVKPGNSQTQEVDQVADSSAIMADVQITYENEAYAHDDK